jgi:HEAT repeat protein
MRGSAARFGLLFLAVAALGGLAWYVGGGPFPSESPSFESQLEGLSSWWASTRRAAAAGLGEFTDRKDEAVPALVKALDDRDEEVRRGALASLRSFGAAVRPSTPRLVELAKGDPGEAVRREALGLLAGLRAAEAVPLLVAALSDPDPAARAEAARGLGLLGPKATDPAAVEGLLNLVRPGQPDAVRAAAVEALQSVARDSEDVHRVLVDEVLADDPSPTVRAQVMAGLRTANDKDRVDVLIKSLDDPSPQIRLLAGAGLARIGVDDDRAIPALCRAAAKADESTDEGMSADLEQVSLQPTGDRPPDEVLARRYEAAAREFKALAELRRGVSRGAAMNLLSRLIAAYKKAPKPYLAEPARIGVETILGRVVDEHEDMPFRLQAINQWTTIAAGASGAGEGEGEALRPSAVWLVRLAEMLRSPAAPIRARAGEILVDSSSREQADVSIREAWKGTVPGLVEALKSDDPRAATAALAVLQNLGPEAAGSLDAVKALAAGAGPMAPAAAQAARRIGALEDLKNPDPAARAAAAEVLGGLSWRGAPAVPGLIDALKDADPKVRKVAAAALGGLAAESDAAVDPLIALFRSESVAEAKAAALAALDRIAPQSKTTLDAHRDALRDADPAVRLAGASFPSPPPADDVVTALADAIGDADPKVAKAAATALAQLVGASPLAIPALFRALAGPEDDPRRAVAGDALFAHVAEFTGQADYARSQRDDRDAKRPPDTTFRAIVAASLAPLDQALKSEDPDARLIAAAYLGRLVAASKFTRDEAARKALEPGLESLLATLGGDDAEVRADVLERLKEIRLRPEAVVAALLKLLEKPPADGEEDDRGKAFDALVAMAKGAGSNPGAPEALADAEPAMTAALDDPDPYKRSGAARVLAAIEAARAGAERSK